MPTMTILVGNIGSGKSLIASKLHKLFGDVVVNMDSIQGMMAAGDYNAYDSNKKEIYRSAEEAAIQKSLEKKISVVIDRTNMDKKSRERFIAIGKQHGAEIVAYDWGKGSKDNLERRLVNSRGIMASHWRDVFEFMKKSYEQPTKDEGFSFIDQPPSKFKFHAFDFDGTIATNANDPSGGAPRIGEIIDGTVEKMNELYSDLSNIIIIWTCRSGDLEAKMREFLKLKKVPYDFINENPLWESGSRKIFAHEYYDDRNAEAS